MSQIQFIDIADQEEMENPSEGQKKALEVLPKLGKIL